MKRIFILYSLALFFYSTVTLATSSTEVAPISSDTKPMTLCPNVSINGVTLTTAPQATPLGDVSDCIDVDAGIIAWVGGYILIIPDLIITANFNGACPPDHPYMGSVDETWAGVMPWGGGGNMKITCCATPAVNVSATSQWVQTTCP